MEVEECSVLVRGLGIGLLVVGALTCSSVEGEG